MLDKKLFRSSNINCLNSITILGSGTSTGTPIVGCSCSTCQSVDPNDTRLRTSFIIRPTSGKTILVETSPDLRTQLLNEKVSSIDAVIITHHHADHLHGIDDLRPLCFQKNNEVIPVYSVKKTLKVIRKRFNYIFDKKPLLGGGIPLLELRKAVNKMNIADEPFNFFLLPHGRCESLGFMHKGFVYIPDCEAIPDEVVIQIQKAKCHTLLITCLQPQEHDTHLNVEKCFHYIELIKPKQAFLIHMNHHLSHESLTEMCAERFNFPVKPAFDGAKYYY